MTPEQEKEFNSRIDDIEKQLGRPIAKDEFTRLHGKYVDELASAPAEAPYGLQTIDKVASKLPWVQGYGLQKGVRDSAIDAVTEKYPTASKVADLAMLAMSPLAYGAKYAAVEGMKALGVEHPENYNLKKILPRTSEALHENLDISDIVPLALMSRGTIKPSAGESMATKGLRRTYNTALDPIGSLLKYPDWVKEQDFNKSKIKQDQFKKEMADKIEQERPQPLSEEEMVIAQQLANNNMLPLQTEASRRLQNVQQSLRDQGVTSGQLASDIVSTQKYGLSDADVVYLSQHPEFGGHPEIQRMAQNIAQREQAQRKLSIPEGGRRSPQPTLEARGEQNPATETFTLPEEQLDAAKSGLLGPEFEGLYTHKNPVRQPLRQVVEQPPLRGLEDVAGTGGPVSIDHQYGGVLPQPEIRVPEGAEAPVLGDSTFTKEGVAVPKYELNPQENFDMSKYPAEAHIPDDIYGLRRKIDEAANWIYNKQGIKEAGKDSTLGAIASKIREKYQKSPEPLAPKFRSEHIAKVVQAENARIAEANKLAPPEAQQPLIEFPKTIGEATSLLNKDTVRAFEQQEKLSPAIKGEREISLINQMGGSGDPRALAEELRITRQYPELQELADRVQRAKKYNDDVASFETKRTRLEKETNSIPYSKANINLADPQFMDNMLSSLAFWGPEVTMRKYGSLAAGHLAGKGLSKLSESPAGKFIKESPKFPGPYRSIKDNSDDPFKY